MLNYLSVNSSLIKNNGNDIIIRIIDNELFYTDDTTMSNDAVYTQILNNAGDDKNPNIIFYIKIDTNNLLYNINNFLIWDLVLQINITSKGFVTNISKVVNNNVVLLKIILSYDNVNIKDVLTFKNNLSNTVFYNNILTNTIYAKYNNEINNSLVYNTNPYNILFINKKIDFYLIDTLVSYDFTNKTLDIMLKHIGKLECWSYNINNVISDTVKNTNKITVPINLYNDYVLKITVFNSGNKSILRERCYSFDLSGNKSSIVSPMALSVLSNIYIVNVNSNKYIINNSENNGVLNLKKNNFYYFDQINDSNMSYPLGIFLNDSKTLYEHAIYCLNNKSVTPITYLLNFNKSMSRYIYLYIPKNINVTSLNYNHLYNLYDEKNINFINDNIINIY